jgi:hypothetical protein
MRALLLGVAAAAALGGACRGRDGGTGGRTPCARLIEREEACNYRGRKAFDATARDVFLRECEERRDRPEYVRALACPDEEGCEAFADCLDASGTE